LTGKLKETTDLIGLFLLYEQELGTGKWSRENAQFDGFFLLSHRNVFYSVWSQGKKAKSSSTFPRELKWKTKNNHNYTNLIGLFLLTVHLYCI